VEEIGPQGVPDPPYKPYPPRYSGVRNQVSPGYRRPHGNFPESRLRLAWTVTRGKWGVDSHGDVIMGWSGQGVVVGVTNRIGGEPDGDSGGQIRVGRRAGRGQLPLRGVW
jgi:hypothetical protein